MAKIRLDKEAVLHAAITVADNKGLNNLTLKELAEELKIKTPSLYNHIDGLQGLYSLMAVYGLKNLKTELAEAAIGLSGKEALSSMGIAYFKFAKTHPGLYEATQMTCYFKCEEAEKLSNEIIKLFGRIVEPLKLDDTTLIHVIRMFRSMLHGFSVLEKKEGFGMPVSVDESFRLTLDILIESIYTTYGK